MSRVPRTEKIVVGADLNGHVGKHAGVFQRVHWGKGCGHRKREGENILESMESLDLALVNTFFNKKEEHLITYKSGGNSSQIDFIMTRRVDLKEMRDFRILPGEEVVSQHRLLCGSWGQKKKNIWGGTEKRGLRSDSEWRKSDGIQRQRSTRRARGVNPERKSRWWCHKRKTPLLPCRPVEEDQRLGPPLNNCGWYQEGHPIIKKSAKNNAWISTMDE